MNLTGTLERGVMAQNESRPAVWRVSVIAVIRRVGHYSTRMRTCVAAGGRRLDNAVRRFEPWGIVLTFIGLLAALLTVAVDLEDRQAERIFRAWQIVWGFQNQVEQADQDGGQSESLSPERVGASGSSLREALEYLNREFPGRFCGSWIRWVSLSLTGNNNRECLFPAKDRESLAGLKGRSADLQSAFLVDANLASADLSVAFLPDADLTGAFLRGADLRGALLLNANLASTDLRGADLTGASLADASLRGADLTGADLSDASLWGADLTGADLTGADLTDAILWGAVLTDADLSGTDLTNARLSSMSASLPDVVGLTQKQLDSACGDTPVSLPTDRTWRSRPCPVP